VSEENERLFVRVMEEAFNRGNLDVVDELVAPDFFNHKAPDARGPASRRPHAGCGPRSPAFTPSCISWWPRATWWLAA
jgi:hypothetical protein